MARSDSRALDAYAIVESWLPPSLPSSIQSLKMRDDSVQYCESADVILQQLAKAGYPLSRDQLSEWHRQGVLPKPKLVWPGDGGSESWYPRGTAVLAVNCAGLLRRGWTFEQAGWELWLAGFPVRKRLWRRVVERGLGQLTSFAQDGSVGEQGDREFSERLEADLREFAIAPDLKRPFGSMRRRLRNEFEAGISLAMSAAIGALHLGAVETSDEQLVGRLTGITSGPKKRSTPNAALLHDHSKDFLERLKDISAAMDARLEVGFESNDNYVMAARDDFVFALRCYRSIQAEEEKQTGSIRPEAKILFDILASTTPYQQAAFMILFSNIVDACGWRPAFEAFKHAIKQEVARQLHDK